MVTQFDLDWYLQLIEELKTKAIDDLAHKELIQKLPTLDYYSKILPLSQIQPTKVTRQDLEQYENTYRVKLPAFLKFLLTEIGQSDLIRVYPHQNGAIRPPDTYLSDELFVECVEAGVKQEVLELPEVYYQIETNTFTDSISQDVYEKLGSNDDRHIHKLLYLMDEGCDCSACVILNSEGNGEVVVTGAWASTVHLINGKQYFNTSFGRPDKRQLTLEEYCLKRLETAIAQNYYSVDDLKSLYG